MEYTGAELIRQFKKTKTQGSPWCYLSIIKKHWGITDKRMTALIQSILQGDEPRTIDGWTIAFELDTSYRKSYMGYNLMTIYQNLEEVPYPSPIKRSRDKRESTMSIKTGLLDGVLSKYVEIKMSPPISDSVWASQRTNCLICKLCGFTVYRYEVRSRGNRAGRLGYGNKYWGMKSKMVSHFCKEHPDIWATLERE